MAALDFPAAPVINQTYGAPNGVTYQWTGELWAAVGNTSGPSPGGDFMAVSTVDISLTGAGLVLILPTVLTGNAGGWYSPSTGRFTPPAGRYFLQAQFSAWNGGGTGGTSTVQLRKNGVAIPNAYGSTTPSGNQGMAVATALVDANGTDYFDCFGLTGASQGAVRPSFQAFPISGVRGPPGLPFEYNGGDFCATGNITFPAAATVAVLPTIVSGNSGNWYNPANGRFTPPAGRYFLFGGVIAQKSDTGTIAIASIAKNGSNVVNAYNTTYAGSAYGTPTPAVVLDANGSDYFTLTTSSNAGSNQPNQAWFGAYPISGIKGPPGDPGQLGFRLLQRTEIVAAAPDVTIQGIPSDINSLRFEFDLTPSLNAQTLMMQFYDATGVLDNVSGHYGHALTQAWNGISGGGAPAAIGNTSTTITNGIPFDYASPSSRVGNVSGIRGFGMVANIRAAARSKSMNFQADYVDDAGTFLRLITGGGWRSTTGAITGLRMVFGSGNIGSGAFSVWGSP